jgi:homoserine dehydrogenase
VTGTAAPTSPASSADATGFAHESEPLERLPLDDVRTKGYIRLIVEDRPGVLAQVANRLGGSSVSVAQMFQEPGVRGEASITMLTHEARDKDFRDAVRAIGELPSIRKKPRAVRIFDI